MTQCSAKERIGRLVIRQHGRVTWAQLKRLDVSDSTIHTWLNDRYLVRVLPKVYAVGHRAPSREADLWAAILYAGPGAMLSHGTAAQWIGLIDYPPRAIEVTTPRRIKSINGIVVHGQRALPRHLHKRLPVTSIAQTVLDLAATADLRLVRKALANLDYRHQLDVKALHAICEHGRPGSKRLKQALSNHQPELAHTNSPLEVDFLEFCERHHVPIPTFNTILHGIQVDAHWPGTKLVIELDGYDNHSSRAQLRRDKRNDLELRQHGLTVLRYDKDLLRRQPRPIRDEILAEIRGAPGQPRRAPSAPPPPRRRPAPGSPRRPSG